MLCKAIGFNCENKGTISNPHFGPICCNKGHIILKQLPVLPQKLLDLLNNNDVLSQYYQKHIRKFNSAMAIPSFQAPYEVNPRGAPYSFIIQGQVYRRMGCIRDCPGEPPRCIQTYFYDSSEQALIQTNQMARAKDCNIEFDMAHGSGRRQFQMLVDSVLRQAGPSNQMSVFDRL
jgi:hypothetical protein